MSERVVVAEDTQQQQQLDWERRQRVPAAAAAILAGLLTLGAELWNASIFRAAPHVSFATSLSQALLPGPVGARPSARRAFYAFYDAHGAALIGASAVRAVGYVAVAWALTFLAATVRNRRPEFPRPALYFGLVGGVLVAISVILTVVGSSIAVNHFLAGPQTVDTARDIGNETLIVTAGFIGLIGSLALAAGFVLTSLNAMRVGLLTRGLGFFGIIVGVLVIFPIGLFATILQSLWLIVIGVLFAAVRAQVVPPAWRSGRAEPWPTRRAPGATAGRSAGDDRSTSADAPRKRKRRT